MPPACLSPQERQIRMRVWRYGSSFARPLRSLRDTQALLAQYISSLMSTTNGGCPASVASSQLARAGLPGPPLPLCFHPLRGLETALSIVAAHRLALG